MELTQEHKHVEPLLAVQRETRFDVLGAGLGRLADRLSDTA